MLVMAALQELTVFQRLQRTLGDADAAWVWGNKNDRHLRLP